MSRYYGNIEGNMGEATRQGTADSGFSASARSYIGSVTVQLWSKDEGREKRDHVRISVTSGSHVGGCPVFDGDLADLVSAVERGAVLRLVEGE